MSPPAKRRPFLEHLLSVPIQMQGLGRSQYPPVPGSSPGSKALTRPRTPGCDIGKFGINLALQIVQNLADVVSWCHLTLGYAGETPASARTVVTL
jgi:hypothetical protein